MLGTQQPVDSCHIEEGWLWNWRGLVTYVFPKIDVQVSAILRSMANTRPTNDPASNGASLAGNYVMTNAQVIAAAGRPLAGNGQNITVNLSKQGDIYPDRLNTVDMRFSKILRFGRTRSQRRDRSLQPVQREHGDDVQPGLRGTTARRGSGRRRS